VKPYYEHGGITIYHGDCREILPTLPKVDLVLTDPQYGIGQDRGMGGCGYDGFGKETMRNPRRYEGTWDRERPTKETIVLVLSSAVNAVIWGGNYFSDLLPVNGKWLIWDKEQTMPSYSDAELAWTNLDGVSVKMFRYSGNGLLAREKNRQHPTQKPVALMKWCLGFYPGARTIIDPFAGSCTTAVAAKQLSRKCICIEIEERYAEIGAKRLSQEVLPLRGDLPLVPRALTGDVQSTLFGLPGAGEERED
jgi:DNA modification methylase